MTNTEKEIILAKIQEIEKAIRDIPCSEATLFDQEEEIAESAISAISAITTIEKPKPKRTRITDGTMTASQIAHRLTRELGHPVSREKVIKVAKGCGAKAVYNETQHNSRYTPESVRMVTSLFRSIL